MGTLSSVNQVFLKFEILSSNAVFEEFVYRILKDLLDKSFFNTWQVTSSENVCTGRSRIDFSWNLVPLYTTVSKNSLSVRYFSREFVSWVM